MIVKNLSHNIALGVCTAIAFTSLLGANTLPARAADARCTTQTTVKLRKGPGQSFDTLAELKKGTPLTPKAYTTKGNPSGEWIRIEVSGTNQKGWVNASPQIVSCTIDVKALPKEDPATTGNPDVATEVGQYPRTPHSGNDGEVEGDTVMPSLPKLKDPTQPLIFKNKINLRVIVRDKTVANKRDGAGIQQVSFRIETIAKDAECGGSGDTTVYERVEKNHSYCLFGGDDATCSSALDLKKTSKWPDDKKTPITNGRYKVSAQIDLSDTDRAGSGAFWFTCFEIQGLAK